MIERRGRVRLGAAALALISAACTHSVPPTATGVPLASAAAPSTRPGLSSTPRPTAPDAASIQVHWLGAAHAPGDAPVSAAGQVLWTEGHRWLPEIWRYVPGSPIPEQIFLSPRREPIITSLVASAAGYAFVEQSGPDFGDGGWRVWYLARPGTEPVELARGVAKEAGFAPTIAMDDRRVAWAGFDEPSTSFVSRLAVAEIADIEHPRTLLERAVDASLLWYPCLNGDELWYAVIDPRSDPTADGPEYHLEMLDLAQPGDGPVAFPGGTHDFNPAVNARYVAWKANERGDSALNWGTIKVLDRQSRRITTIPVEHANRPSIGDRFATVEELFHHRLPVYDLATSTLVDLSGARPPDATGAMHYSGESVSGRLLTFAASGRIGWAILPE